MAPGIVLPFLLILPLMLPALDTIHVNNLTGDDRNPGTASAPVKSIRRGISLLSPSGHLEVANTGKVYSDSYPGAAGSAMIVSVSGSMERPVILNGNGATYSRTGGNTTGKMVA